MNNLLKTLVVAAAVTVLGLVAFQTGWSQTVSPVFVVYGTMTTQDGNPVEGTYTIVIENLRTGAVVDDDVGAGENAGKFAVVFIDYYGGSVVMAGDEIGISVRIGQTPVTGAYEIHQVTAEDVLDMRVMINIIEPQVAVDSKTWGAIKSLYQ
ncbi:MAG: hypothetical protein JSW50_08535 [Candidatus Latescibacterota bacterium]|nr:MAG: hypothetical protein JSW50_08535 [Candidatus Latescibacterota bacterium]